MTSLFRGPGGGLLRIPGGTALMRGETCCCGPVPVCVDCLENTTPKTITVRIGGIEGVVFGCNCAAINGDFELPPLFGVLTSCQWGDEFIWVPGEGCGGYGLMGFIYLGTGPTEVYAQIMHYHFGLLADFSAAIVAPINCKVDLVGMTFIQLHSYSGPNLCDGTAATFEVLSVT